MKVGFRPMTKDLLPLLGHIKGTDLIAAAGFGPSGLTIGPYAGSLAASLVFGEEPGLNLEKYDPTRKM
ncbi:hypothetical protein [Bacillus haynesii]|uniref:hypothetical protein n=1 Tax=Bacillus haynesii TaxID=1925021 RepID=UPI0022829419|nr:hypothetical protein [Bacillus haynesii]MCY7994042.1 FAD-binding oxidoreductase [Bacillus haynesii]